MKTKGQGFVARGRKGKLKGFTLVELMVTVTIIGILTTLGVVTYSRAQARARDGRREADMTTIQNALEMYASEHSGDYPSHARWARSNDGDDWIPGLRPTYIKSIPKETYGDYYLYAYDSTTIGWVGGYVLLMHKETEDGGACTQLTGAPLYGGYWDCTQSP